jgi:hypothetical protein
MTVLDFKNRAAIQLWHDDASAASSAGATHLSAALENRIAPSPGSARMGSPKPKN